MIILCTVDITTREVTIPSDQRIASYDHKVDVIRFQVETIPGFSLDTSSIKIAAQGPNKARHDYAVDPSTVQIEEETGYITFDWPIPAGVTEMPIGTFKYGDKGQLIFAVCAEIIDGSTVSKAWHSDDGIITVVAHLEPEAGGGEDPEETATNAQKIAQLQTDVAVMGTQVGALANGSPTPVATVAEMTDESAVYLYTGSETGYTAGNWYYYNGSAWTSGGVYGGAVTDTTLSISGKPADAKTVGDALASISLEIDETDGLLYVYVGGQKQGEGIELITGTRYTVSFNLAPNIVSSNTSTKVVEGNAYTTTINSSDPDYQLDTITVTMGGTDITSTAVSGNIVSIASVTGNIGITATAVYYPAVETDSSSLTIATGGTGTLGVKLHAQPMQSQTVRVYSDDLTLDKSSLTFTTSNWNTYQYVGISAPVVEVTTYANIMLTNSDPLMTESTVLVTIKELGYEDLVDTTIPTGAHVLTADDFTEVKPYSSGGRSYQRLYGYNGAYTNVIVPAEFNGNPVFVTSTASSPGTSNSTFGTNTTIQYVTFEDGVAVGEGGNPGSTSGAGLFQGCTSLIGVSNLPSNTTSLSSAFNGCTALKFIDNLDELTACTSLSQTFKDSGIEYVQDLSAMVALANIGQTFRNASSLIKVFGLPVLASASAITNTYAGCSDLEYGIVPEGTNGTTYAFSNCSSLKRVDIFEDGLTTTTLSNTMLSGTSNVTVYCNAGTTTYDSLVSVYGSSSSVTIKTFGSASALPSIVVWGDSISSPNKPWIEWPARLQTKIGTSEYAVKNEALAGEGSPSTTARQGGYVMTVGAFTIPATVTAAEITIMVNGDETFSNIAADESPYAGIFSAGASFNPCTISGVKGFISRSGSQYYFTRLEAGTAVNVSAGTAITSDKDTTFNNADNVMIFYLNGNAGWHNDADRLLDMFQKAVTHFTALGGTKYIVAGPAANVILTNSATKAEVLEFEGKAATAFGSHWLNLREYEIQNGLTENNLTASALDTQRMADGLVPASLVGGGDTTNIVMYDGTSEHGDQNHPNVYGANTIMLAFYNKGKALGYWS